jgi:hypothetical protein
MTLDAVQAVIVAVVGRRRLDGRAFVAAGGYLKRKVGVVCRDGGG